MIGLLAICLMLVLGVVCLSEHATCGQYCADQVLVLSPPTKRIVHLEVGNKTNIISTPINWVRKILIFATVCHIRHYALLAARK
jgi:hypothetical protein